MNRQAPLAMVLLTLVKAWCARCARDEPDLQPEATPWNRRKARPSFLDMLSAIRSVLWHHRISGKSRSSKQVGRIIKAVSYALFAAA